MKLFFEAVSSITPPEAQLIIDTPTNQLTFDDIKSCFDLYLAEYEQVKGSDDSDDSINFYKKYKPLASRLKEFEGPTRTSILSGITYQKYGKLTAAVRIKGYEMLSSIVWTFPHGWKYGR